MFPTFRNRLRYQLNVRAGRYSTNLTVRFRPNFNVFVVLRIFSNPRTPEKSRNVRAPGNEREFNRNCRPPTANKPIFHHRAWCLASAPKYYVLGFDERITFLFRFVSIEQRRWYRAMFQIVIRLDEQIRFVFASK